MAGLPGLPPPGFSTAQEGAPTEIVIGSNRGLPGLPPPGFSQSSSMPNQQEAPGFFESVGTGAKTFIPSLLSSLSDIPSGLKNIYESTTSPIDSILNGTTEKVARGVGGISSGIAGAGVGAMAAAPLAPFTLGLSVPVGAALGGAAGLLGFNKLNQAVGSDKPTSNAEDVAMLGNATGQGLAGSALFKSLSLGAKGVSNVANKVGSSLDDAAQSSLEKGLGVQYGDRVKGLDKANLYVDDTGNTIPFDRLDEASSIEAPIQRQIEVIKNAGYLDNAPNSADSLKIHLEKIRGGVGQSIQRMINEGDAIVKGQEPLPDFSKAQEYVNSFRDSTKASLSKELNSIIDDYILEPGSGFKKLAKFNDKLQKETRFNQPTPPEITQLKRFATYDLRKFTENLWDEAQPQKAGEWAKANEQFSALSSLGKTLNKRMAKNEPGFLSTLTTPVGSGPFLGAGGVGAATLGAGAALPVAGGAWITRALLKGAQNTKPISYAKGVSNVSSILESLGEKVKKVGAVGESLSPYGVSVTALDTNRKQSQKSLKSSQNKGKFPSAKSQKVAGDQQKRYKQETIQTPQGQSIQILRDSSTGQFSSPQKMSEQGFAEKEKQGLKKPPAPKLFDDPSLNSAPDPVASKANIRNAIKESYNELKTMENKTPKTKQVDPKIAAIEKKIDSDPIDSTIYEMESGRNPLAKNTSSTASGGFQLLKKTAANLGVKDVFDLEQNYQGFLKLKGEAERFAEQPSDYYAFHYLGQPTFLAWKKGKLLTNKQQEQVDFLEEELLPKFERIYNSKLKKKSGMVEA